jgi:hypothetical protein
VSSDTAESRPVRGGRWVVQLVLWAAAVALIVLTAVPTAKAIFGGRLPEFRGSSGNPNRFNERFHTNLAAGCDTFVAGEDNRATLIVNTMRLNADSSTLTVELELCLPQRLLLRLRAVGGHHQTVVLHRSPRRRGLVLSARPGYAHVLVGAYINVYDGSFRDPANAVDQIHALLRQTGRYTTFQKLLLGPTPAEPIAGRTSPGGPVSIGRMNLPVASRPSRYPFDWYSAVFATHIEFESGQIGIKDRKYGFYDAIVPSRVVVVPEPTLHPLDLRPAVASEGQNTEEVRLSLIRPGSTKLFVLVVAAIPGVLALLLGITLLGLRRGQQFGTEGFVGVIAALLAILPIRAVLVPSDLSPPTAVDSLLAFEMALLAAIALVGVARSLGRGGRGRNSSASAGEDSGA